MLCWVSLLLAVVGSSALQLGARAPAGVRAPHVAAARSTHLRLQVPEVGEETATTVSEVGTVVPAEAAAAPAPAIEYYVPPVIPAAVLEKALTKITASKPDLGQVIRRAEFWSNETATVLEIINIVGRWNTHSDIATRTTFTEAGGREEDLRQAGTQRRHEMAKKLGCLERVALSMNAPKLPFTNAKLAASVGLTVEDFADIPVTEQACNVVYDALAESKSGLIPYAKIDERRKGFVADDGSLNQVNFKLGLAKSRTLVIISWFVFGKGNFVWVLVAAQALHDIRPDLFPTPKDLNLDKIGFFV